ncbi:MAG: hypothetical protein HY432_01185 [Candidatus Liptonbacteria bacterium]|nr:hypothetical protein [Candidatus Liptonbacteria bacterium]
MFDFIQLFAQKTAGLVVASLAAVFGIFSQTNTLVINPPSDISLLPAETSLVETVSVGTTTIGSLPPDASSTISIKPALSSSSTPGKMTKPRQAAAPAQNSPQENKKTSSAPLPANHIFTPQEVLDKTSFSLNQKPDGVYVLSFHTDIASGFDWGLFDESIGGSALSTSSGQTGLTTGGTQVIPLMKTSFFCNPQWNSPPGNSSDRNPTFDLNTSYTCSVSLTDALMRMSDKKIFFKTGPGRLVIKSSNLSTALKSDKSSNGLVFDNQNTSPIKITGLTFDLSFRGLNVSSPIVLRFINPDNESSYSDFQVQNLPTDPLRPDFRTAAGVKVISPFAVKPNNQRLLRVEILGVQQLLTIGINPEFNVTLKQLDTDNPDAKIVFLSPTISWKCIPFDPTKSLTGIPDDQNCR